MKIITTDAENKAVLYQSATEVTIPLSDETKEKIEAMRVFYKSFGDKAGFAAPQVGISERVILVERNLFDASSADTDEPAILINPAWKPINDKRELDIEGCLSVPGKTGMVMRYTDVELTGWLYSAATGELSPVKREYQREFSSVLWQHEIDHLDGQIYADKAELLLNTEDSFALRQHLADLGEIHEEMTLFDTGQLIYDLALEWHQSQLSVQEFLDNRSEKSRSCKVMS